MLSWRERCPLGHTVVERLSRAGGHYCQTCGRTYAGPIRDATEHDFPLDESEYDVLEEPITEREVLEALVELETDPTSYWIELSSIVAAVDSTTIRVGSKLCALEERGLVEQYERPRDGAPRRTTAAGRRVAGRDGEVEEATA